MDIGSQTRVADIATEYPATIRVFQRHGIDFCCGGKRPLGEVCDEQALSLERVKQDLEAALVAPAEPGAAWNDASPVDLIDYIVERYHQTLREELARLDQMMDKVLRVHGERHPALAEVAATFGAISDDLRPHMLKEEQVLFPYVARLCALASRQEALLGSPFGTVENPIAAMEAEHEMVGQALAALRAQTAGYAPPADACNTFRGLYHGFAELERELHEHIHLENNVLFPRAVQLETELLRSARPAR